MKHVVAGYIIESYISVDRHDQPLHDLTLWMFKFHFLLVFTELLLIN